jgi:hypothetical protein
MATTTTNYGFDIPQSTDLVKDGATAIATLGQDIDTAMNTALGTKKSGMVLLNTTSFSGVASQSVNDVFSTTYTNYRVVANITFSTTAYLNVRMRVAGADNSSNEYVYIVTSVASNQSVENSGSNGLVSSFAEFTRQTVDSTVLAYDFLNPFDTKNTVVLGSGVWNRSASLINGGWYNGILKNNTSYTGFTLIAQTGNITGTVSVYGYNK